MGLELCADLHGVLSIESISILLVHAQELQRSSRAHLCFANNHEDDPPAAASPTRIVGSDGRGLIVAGRIPLLQRHHTNGGL